MMPPRRLARQEQESHGRALTGQAQGRTGAGFRCTDAKSSGVGREDEGFSKFRLLSVHRQMATPGRFTLVTFLCALQPGIVRSNAPSSQDATLDTEHVANAYPGGIRTR